MVQRSRGRRLGNVFALRMRPEERIELERRCAADEGPSKLGPWLIWRGLGGDGQCPSAGNAPTGRAMPRGEVLPAQLGAGAGSTDPGERTEPDPPVAERVILDLCAGSGSWSRPYAEAGYRVRRVTLPADDVRTFRAPPKVWGVLAAPPCTEFSLAKNGHARDLAAGLSVVDACLRLVMLSRPRWWALENPVGLLGRFLGRPLDVFEPYEFGDAWSKRTALWGSFCRPRRGPRVVPLDGGGPICEVCFPDDPRSCSIADHRAVTPPGFARAFLEANP